MRDKERIKMPMLDELSIKEILSESKNSIEENPFDHADLTNRMKRTLYYDPLKQPDTDTLSFSATESAVSRIRHVAPMRMGKLGHRYASRVARDACISPCALLLGLIYIERLKHKNSNYLENVTSSDLFLVSMMVSSKYLYDEGCEDEVFNDEWALSGEMDVARVNKMEREFLKAIDWHLYVNPQEFSSMLNIAETDIALSNGRKRGWLTYSDLRSLLDSQKLYQQLTLTAGILSKTTCLCMIMYSGLVCLAALTSTALVSMSSKPFQNHSPFDTQPYNRRSSISEPSDNDTNSDLDMLEVDPDAWTLREGNRFPSFSLPHRGPRQFVKRRIRFVETDDTQPTAENEVQNMQNGTLAPDKLGLKSLPGSLRNDLPDEFIETSAPVEHSGKVLTLSSPSNIALPIRRSICSILEAVFLVAHVPAICRMDRVPDRCQDCGKPDPKTKSRYQTCDGFHAGKRIVFSNCSIGVNAHIRDVQILPSKRNSMPGVYNSTLPPLLQVHHRNRTDLHRRPIVVV